MSSKVFKLVDGKKPNTSEGRPAWNGQVLKSALAGEGGPLMAMLYGRAAQLGQSMSTVATEELGVTFGYLAQLRNGTRKVRHISDEFAEACAAYLGVPRLTVLIAAGRVRPEDFLERDEEPAAMVQAALGVIRQDAKWGALMPAGVDDPGAPFDLQLFIVRLYEKAEDKVLLKGSEASAEDVAASIQSLNELRERHRKAAEREREEKKAPKK